jgi:hypothetical protein
MQSYQAFAPADTQPLLEFLSRNGQLLLPMVQFIKQSRAALDAASSSSNDWSSMVISSLRMS